MVKKLFLMLLILVLLGGFISSNNQTYSKNLAKDYNIDCSECTEQNIIINENFIEVYNSEVALNDKVAIQKIQAENSIIDVSKDYTGEILISEKSSIKGKNGIFDLSKGSEVMVIKGVITIKNAEEGSKINIESKGEYELSGQSITIQEETITSTQNLKINGREISGESEISLLGEGKYKISGKNIFLSSEKGKINFNGEVIVHKDHHLTKLENTYLTSYYNDKKLRSFSKTNEPIEFYQENGKCKVSNCIEDTPELIKINVANNNKLSVFSENNEILSRLEIDLIEDESLVKFGVKKKDMIIFSKNPIRMNVDYDPTELGLKNIKTKYKFFGGIENFEMMLEEYPQTKNKYFISYSIDGKLIGERLKKNEEVLYRGQISHNRWDKKESFYRGSKGELPKKSSNIVIYTSVDLIQRLYQQNEQENYFTQFSKKIILSQTSENFIPTDSMIVKIPKEVQQETLSNQIAYALAKASESRKIKIKSQLEKSSQSKESINKQNYLEKFTKYFLSQSQQTSASYIASYEVNEKDNSIKITFGKE